MEASRMFFDCVYNTNMYGKKNVERESRSEEQRNSKGGV